MIRVAIIDDHVVVRAGLRYLIEADAELEFVGEFGGGLGAAEFVLSCCPDVVLLDVRMPDRNGIDALKDILAANPKARVVMLTTSDVEEDVFRAIEEGAFGYVMKESEIEVISKAIRSAMAGEVFMTDDVRRIYETRKGSKGLSAREAQVLEVASRGANNKEIAKAMNLSENSVKMFLKRAFFKLGASNRAEAVQLAVKRGLIEAGFTLVEMLVVVVVLITLMSVAFRLGKIGLGDEKRATTIARMQKLENCLSGYYAAFGSYPPVRLHGTRNIYAGVDEWGIQSLDEPNGKRALNDTSSPPMWQQVNAACRSQPVAARYPFDIESEGKTKAIEEIALALQEKCQKDGKEFQAYRNRKKVLQHGFDALERPNAEVKDPTALSWRETQVFEFGLMSFLLPRYAFMTKGDPILYGGGFRQWTDHNETQHRSSNGREYSWNDMRNDLRSNKPGRILSISSQAVCARWMPNLKGAVAGGKEFFGIDTKASGGSFIVSANNPNVQVFCPTKNPSNQYVLDGCTVLDGWGNEFYYYSPVPHQTYRLWSSGPDGKTFPPWIEFSSLDASDRKTAGEWKADDIEFLSN